MLISSLLLLTTIFCKVSLINSCETTKIISRSTIEKCQTEWNCQKCPIQKDAAHCRQCHKPWDSNTTEINLNFNNFTQIEPYSFETYSKYRILNIYHNKLTRLSSNIFIDVDLIKFLRVSYNQISLIESGTFDNMHSLEWLDLKSNNLISIEPNVFKKLNSLRVISMSENRIKDFNNTVKTYFKSLLLLNQTNQLCIDGHLMRLETNKKLVWTTTTTSEID